MDDSGSGGLALLAILWIVGLIVYFTKTTEAQRQGHLVIVWGLMLVPSVIGLLRLLFSP